MTSRFLLFKYVLKLILENLNKALTYNDEEIETEAKFPLCAVIKANEIRQDSPHKVAHQRFHRRGVTTKQSRQFASNKRLAAFDQALKT